MPWTPDARTARLGAGLAMLTLILTGCPSTPPPPPAATLQAQAVVAYLPGPPLADGAVAAVGSATPYATARCEVFGLEAMPAGESWPLVSPRARLVVSDEGPWLVAPVRFSGARLRCSPGVDPSLPEGADAIASADLVVFEAHTSRVRVDVAGAAGRLALSLSQAARAEPEVTLCLSLTGAAGKREELILELPDELPLCCDIALPASVGLGGPVLVRLSVSAPPEPNSRDYVRLRYASKPAREALSGAPPLTAPKIPKRPERLKPDIDLTLMALRGGPDQRRGALIALAHQLAAPLTEALAYSADSPSLNALVLGTCACLEGELGSVEELAWAIERASFATIKERWYKAELGPGPLGALLWVFGGAALNVTRVTSLMDEVTSLDELEAELVVENRAALDDASARTRELAYEWLVARDLEPQGFDPNGPEAERDAALDRYYEVVQSIEDEEGPR